MSRRISAKEDFFREKPPKNRLDELQQYFDKNYLKMDVREFEETIREIHILHARKAASRSLVIK